jgi:hypothetical protein
MPSKWNWQAGLGWVLVVFALTRAGQLFSLTTGVSPEELGYAMGTVTAFCTGLYLIMRSSVKPSN